MLGALVINSRVRKKILSFIVIDIIIITTILLSSNIIFNNSDNEVSYKKFFIFVISLEILSIIIYIFYTIYSYNIRKKRFLKRKYLLVNHFMTKIYKLKKEKKTLSNLLYSINEAIVEISSTNGEIVFANKSFKKIFEFKNYKNRFYWEAIRDNRICNIIKKSIIKKISRQREVNISNGFFICSSYYLSNLKSVILILYNITPLRELEHFKTDLIANVSHELNTPLTSILGFVEYLVSSENDEYRHYYLTVIKNNAIRLINIVKDLLNLSKLELSKEKIDFNDVDILSLIKNVEKVFVHSLHSKNLTFDIICNTDKAVIKGDYDKLTELFINLIDNAIKYSESGGIKILINNSRNGLEIIVKDSGIGIEKDNLKRIFEKFYVVDKARSKKNGGTGLGLSIVKHIVLLHKGSISVKSKVGIGTCFKVVFYS